MDVVVNIGYFKTKKEVTNATKCCADNR